MFGFGPALRDLKVAAQRGELDPAPDRDPEVARAIAMLAAPQRKNLLIVGGEGIGKTGFVHAMALAMFRNPPRYHLLAVDMNTLKCKTVRIYDAVAALVDALAEDPRKVLVLDGILPVFITASHENAALHALGTAIEQGRILCIGTMTDGEFATFTTRDVPIGEAFHVLHLDPLSEEVTFEILRRLEPALEQEYAIRISEKALRKCIRLTQEYLPVQPLPGKAIRVLKEACAHCVRRLQSDAPRAVVDSSLRVLGKEVGTQDLYSALKQCAGIDVNAAEGEKWQATLVNRLQNRVFGQEAALTQIAGVMAQIRARFGGPGCPAGVMLFGGPPGVGKVHAARALARRITGTESGFRVIRLSDYNAQGTVQDLLHALTAVNTEPGDEPSPDSHASMALRFVVFEAIEEAPPALLGPLLRLATTGCLRNGGCNHAALQKCVFILTLNCEAAPPHGPAPSQWLHALVSARIRRDVVDRLDSLVSFGALDYAAQCDIIRRALADFRRGLSPRQVTLRVDDPTYQKLVDQAQDVQQGATRLLRVVQDQLIAPIGNLLRHTSASVDDALEVLVRDGKVTIHRMHASATGAESQD